MTKSSHLGRVGTALFALLLLVAVAGPLIAPYDPTAQVTVPFAAPSWSHLLGADDLGQDLFSQLLVGARTSLLVGVLAALVATVVGSAVGLTAGVARGWVDTILMRVVDVMLTLPFVPLVIVLSAFAGRGFGSTIMVIGLLMWARTARVLRSQVLSARERGPATAARAMGAGQRHILWYHVLPSVFPLVVPELVRAVNAAILLESSLAFLGLGDPSRLSWGSILYHANARSAFLTDAWLWWELPPGLCIGGTVLSFVLFGYALENRLRPRLDVGWRSTPPRVPADVVAEAAPARGHDAPDGDALLCVEALRVEYGSGVGTVHALRGVDLQIRPGEVVGIVGESGSGKSTLAAAALRLLPFTARVAGGAVRVDGRRLDALSDDELRRLRGQRVGLVPQSAMNALNPVRTIGSQVVEGLSQHAALGGGPARARARELLALVGIPAARLDAYPHEFSGGMRQRVVIALAVANNPALLIADEPTTGLDVLLQAELLALLGDLRTRLGLAIVLVSHDLAAVARLADRVIVMQGGLVVDAGATAEILSTPTHPYTRRLVGAMPSLAALPLANATRGELAGGGPPLLRVEGVHKSFGSDGKRVLALQDVSLAVFPGESVGLIGASGAGKSTLARMIVGLVPPDAGRIHLEGLGQPRGGESPRERARLVHLVFQDPYDSLAPGMRVRELVAEPMVIRRVAAGAERDARVARALEDVGLAPVARFLSAFPHELSGGERQRVALARAIVLEPRLIVADEPTSQLDAPLRADMVDLLRRLGARHGTAYLYITHDISVASSFCQRLVILHGGRVVESGATADLLAAPRDDYTRALLGAAGQRVSSPA